MGKIKYPETLSKADSYSLTIHQLNDIILENPTSKYCDIINHYYVNHRTRINETYSIPDTDISTEIKLSIQRERAKKRLNEYLKESQFYQERYKVTPEIKIACNILSNKQPFNGFTPVINLTKLLNGTMFDQTFVRAYLNLYKAAVNVVLGKLMCYKFYDTYRHYTQAIRDLQLNNEKHYFIRLIQHYEFEMIYREMEEGSCKHMTEFFKEKSSVRKDFQQKIYIREVMEYYKKHNKDEKYFFEHRKPYESKERIKKELNLIYGKFKFDNLGKIYRYIEDQYKLKIL